MNKLFTLAIGLLILIFIAAHSHSSPDNSFLYVAKILYGAGYSWFVAHLWWKYCWRE